MFAQRVKPQMPNDYLVNRTNDKTAWGHTIFLVLLYLLNWSDKAVFGLVAQPMAHELGITPSQIGLIGSSFFFAFTVGGFFSGYLNKLMGLRTAMAVMAASWAFCMLPVVMAPMFTVLLIGRMALGFTEGPSGALLYTAVYSWHAPEKRGIPSAWITACSSLSKTLSAPLLTIIIVSHGWRAALMTLACLSILWCLIWLAVWEEGPFGASKAQGSESSIEGGQGLRLPWLVLFRSPTFVGGAVAVLSMYSIISVVITWLPSYFETGLGYSRLQAGTMFGLPGIVALVTMFGSGYIGDRMMSRGHSARVYRGIVLSVGLLLCGVSLAALPYVSSRALAVTIISLGYGAGSVVLPLASACVSQISPRPQLSGALGLFFSIMSIGGIFAPYITGKIVNAASLPVEGYSGAFQVFGIAAVAASVLAFLTINPERDAMILSKLDAPR